MKTVRIITLHLAYGGIEKAVCQMASMFAEKYDVEIISVYDMPDAPAFPIDERVRVRYLLDEIPNRDEWRDCARRKDVFGLARESLKAARILHDKKKAVIDAVSAIDDGVIITTRPEHNVLLSKYGRPGVYKLGQLHQDHCFDKKLLDSFIFPTLTPLFPCRRPVSPSCLTASAATTAVLTRLFFSRPALPMRCARLCGIISTLK